MSVETLPTTSETSGEIALNVELGRLYRFSPEQYDAMAAHGILTPDDRVELLEGWVVHKMGKNQPHVIVTCLIHTVLTRLLPPGWFVMNQDPIRTDRSMPEPDLAVVRGTPRDYLKRRIGPTDLGLVVEVSDSTLKDDRTFKQQIYARSGVPFYWVANIPGSRLLVFSDPTGPAATPDYRQMAELGPDDEVVLVLDGREVGRIAVRDILP